MDSCVRATLWVVRRSSRSPDQRLRVALVHESVGRMPLQARAEAQPHVSYAELSDCSLRASDPG